MKVKDAVKAATDKYCELMNEKGFGCCPESYCWKMCGCEETEAIRAAIQQANQPDNSCEHSFSPVYQCVHCGKIGDSIA